MKCRPLLPCIVGLVAVAACHASAGQLSAADVYGQWRIIRINATGEITESEQRMNALLGTTLTLSADKVLEAGESPCRVVKPYPVVSTVDTADEVPIKAAASPAAAGLPPRAVMVDLGCIAVFVVDGHLVFSGRGAWYTAERVKR
jgi:hypothetical protein